jgi:hypothetical protein
LPRIPDFIIKQIPEIILKPRLPIPIPDPGPLKNIEIPNLKNRFNLKVNPALKIPIRPGVPQPIVKESDMDINMPDTARKQLLSGDIGMIREAIEKNFTLFRPIFMDMALLL